MDFLIDAQKYENEQSGLNNFAADGKPEGTPTGKWKKWETRKLKWDCFDKNVIVIGGGDTAVDWIGIWIRHGAKSVAQFSRRGKWPDTRPEHTLWPSWSDTFRVDYWHAEYLWLTKGTDPRQYYVSTKKFIVNVKGIITKVVWEKKLNNTVEDVTYDADIVIL